MATSAEARLASLAKPPGSLGLLEEWAITLCQLQNTLKPVAEPQSVLVFCADHGVKKEDAALSPFPASVSAAVFRALAAGISATARWKNGFEISGLVGRRWRSEADPAFDVSSNLDGTVSDWLVSASVDFNDYFSIDTKLRLDDDSLDINRLDDGGVS